MQIYENIIIKDGARLIQDHLQIYKNDSTMASYFVSS